MSNKTTLLLVGRSGSGKSSVGNSILRKPAFKPSGMRQETMLSNDVASNDEFFVVDCSGVGDTGSDMVGDVKDVIQNAKNAVNKIMGVTTSEFNVFELVYEPDRTETPNAEDILKDVEIIPDSIDSPGIGNSFTNENQQEDSQETESKSISVDIKGFDTLIFVLKYDVQCTKQEKDAVQMVKSIFGENVLRDWGVFVFSYGDNFYLDSEDDEITFEDWCREQTGDIKLLFEEVNYRCVIFDNKSTNKDNELENLKGNIEKVTKGGRPYTLADFDNAKSVRVKLQLNYPNGGLQAETHRLFTKTNQLMEQSTPDCEELRENLEDLLQQVEKLINLDEGTGVLKPLLEHVDEEIATLEAKMKQSKSSVDQRRSVVKVVWKYFAKLKNDWKNPNTEIKEPSNINENKPKQQNDPKESESKQQSNPKNVNQNNKHDPKESEPKQQSDPKESEPKQQSDPKNVNQNNKIDPKVSEPKQQNDPKESESKQQNYPRKNKTKQQSRRKECEPEPVNRKECEPEEVNRKECEPEPVNRKECDPGPVNRKECQPEPVNRKECDPGPVNRKECETEPVTRKECEPEPVNCKECEPKQLDSLDCKSTEDDSFEDTLNVKSTDQQNYAFLLVGRSGNGKSSTGNSIFGKNVFITRKLHDSYGGDVICYHSALVDGRTVFVVDGSGIGDIGEDINGAINELLESIDFTMRNDMSKFSAIILVHFIHERSQANMKSSVHAIKSILGSNVFKNWGIIVVTFGDQFDVDNLDENIHSFEDWCQQQTGYFQILLEECNNRCVLFDNKTTDKNKQMEQRNKLMSVVDSMTYKKYTMDDFNSPPCKLSRKQLILMKEVSRKFEEFDVNM